jgi:CRP-like cAMP-binding protein
MDPQSTGVVNTPIATAPRSDEPAKVSAGPDLGVGETSESQARALYDLIAQQPFFMGLNAGHLQQLADSALEMSFEPGESIFAEGSPANRFYLILHGRVVLESEMVDRNVIPVQTLGPGDDLGWSWLFPPYSLCFSARALEPTTTILFYAARLRDQCEQDHEFGYQLMKRVAKVTTQRLRATQQRLMDYLDKGNLSQADHTRSELEDEAADLRKH